MKNSAWIQDAMINGIMKRYVSKAVPRTMNGSVEF